MQKQPPPLLGFNNNVRHRGKVFHIQTEDSGIKHARIATHLFADGGRIVDSTRLDYSEHLGREDMTQVLRQLMKEQHKSMFVRLRAGTLDARIEAACGPLPMPPPETAAPETEAGGRPPRVETVNAGDSVLAGRTGSSSSRLHATPPPTSSTPSLSSPGRASEPSPLSAGGTLEAVPPPGPPAELPMLAADPEAGSEIPGEEARYAQPRPASIFGEMPPLGNSIFGERMISEQSLDEVILSYLAEDLEGTNE